MAPIGGGPPAGFAGGSFTGAAEALEIYGDFGAAYSGKLALSNQTKTALEFTTGNYLAVVDLFVGFDITGLQSGNEIGYEVYFNGIEIMDVVSNYSASWMVTGGTAPKFVIPPYTEVRVDLYTDDASGINMAAMLTGRIYRD